MPRVSKVLWLVEQQWDTGSAMFPIRSVVRASTQAMAARRAAGAILDAVEVLAGRIVGKAVGSPVVLRRIALGQMTSERCDGPDDLGALRAAQEGGS